MTRPEEHQRAAPARAAGRSLLASGSSQFAGQVLGILIAVLVSHLIARRMGVGPEADAFLLGRRLVTSVSEVLNQVVVVVFIPLIAARAAAGDGIGRILRQSGGAALALGAVLALGFGLAAPALVDRFGPEFDVATAALSAQVIRLLALALPATVATIAFAAYCNVRGHFGLPAAIRQVPRAAVALALLVGGGSLAPKAALSYTLAFCAVAAVTLVYALSLTADTRATVTARTSPAAVTRRGTAAIMLTLGALASIWLETAFAARQGIGAVSLLDFGQRLGALCGNTLAMALALVTFAALSRHEAEGAKGGLDIRFEQATLTALGVMVPLQVGVLVNAPAIVDVIIAHGAFPPDAVSRLTELVRWMACAPVAALVTRMLLMRVLAERDLPIVRLIGGAVCLDVLTRLALFTLLTPVLGLLAIPVALTFAPLAPAALLVFLLRRRGLFASTASLSRAKPVLIGSAGVSVAIVAGAAFGPVVAPTVQSVLGTVPKIASLAQLAVSGLVGTAALAAAVSLLKLRPSLTDPLQDESRF